MAETEKITILEMGTNTKGLKMSIELPQAPKDSVNREFEKGVLSAFVAKTESAPYMWATPSELHQQVLHTSYYREAKNAAKATLAKKKKCSDKALADAMRKKMSAVLDPSKKHYKTVRASWRHLDRSVPLLLLHHSPRMLMYLPPIEYEDEKEQEADLDLSVDGTIAPSTA